MEKAACCGHACERERYGSVLGGADRGEPLAQAASFTAHQPGPVSGQRRTS